VDSYSSQEGLLTIDQLAKQYARPDLVVWAITISEKGKVVDFVSRTDIRFPVLLDESTEVSDLYQARIILPTVCILGPGMKVLDYLQGGGKGTEKMLVRLAERNLQRKQTEMAKTLGDQVLEKNPKNIEAKTIKGYAALQEGDLEEADRIFSNVSKEKGQGEILGKEGLMAVYEKEGEQEKALVLAKEVEERAPDRAYVHVFKGDRLYRQGKKEEARKEYMKAVQKEAAESHQKALAYNKLGRLNASLGDYQSARELYDQAVEINPYYVEVMSNRGRTYEEEGQWDKALDAYNEALSLDKNDAFSAVLARKAKEMLDFQKDVERKERVDKLVNELAERYRTQKSLRTKSKDPWTTRPMILTFVDFQEKGGLAERDGYSDVLITQLGEQLNSSGRVQVVERILIERLLEELNLSASDLVDPETKLRLGEILAAKLIGTGSVYFMANETVLSLRLIDTETSAVPKVITRKLSSLAQLEQELLSLDREVLKTVMMKYPLCGYVIDVTTDRVMVNIGSKHGVVQGTAFEVLEDQEPIKYRGRVIQPAPKSIAKIEITQVETDLCYARILNQERPLKRDDKVREMVEDIQTIGELDEI
jgi:tetratricopeptide (TPR) repeat protein